MEYFDAVAVTQRGLIFPAKDGSARAAEIVAPAASFADPIRSPALVAGELAKRQEIEVAESLNYSANCLTMWLSPKHLAAAAEKGLTAEQNCSYC